MHWLHPASALTRFVRRLRCFSSPVPWPLAAGFGLYLSPIQSLHSCVRLSCPAGMLAAFLLLAHRLLPPCPPGEQRARGPSIAPLTRIAMQPSVQFAASSLLLGVSCPLLGRTPRVRTDTVAPLSPNARRLRLASLWLASRRLSRSYSAPERTFLTINRTPPCGQRLRRRGSSKEALRFDHYMGNAAHYHQHFAIKSNHPERPGHKKIPPHFAHILEQRRI